MVFNQLNSMLILKWIKPDSAHFLFFSLLGQVDKQVVLIDDEFLVTNSDHVMGAHYFLLCSMHVERLHVLCKVIMDK